MEYAILIVVAVIFSLLDEKISSKKRVPPKSSRNRKSKLPKSSDEPIPGTGFEIPPINKAPKTDQAGSIFTSKNEETCILLEQEKLRAKWEEAKRKAIELREVSGGNKDLVMPNLAPINKGIIIKDISFSIKNLKEAVIVAEILGKPRAVNPLSRR